VSEAKTLKELKALFVIVMLKKKAYALFVPVASVNGSRSIK